MCVCVYTWDLVGVLWVQELKTTRNVQIPTLTRSVSPTRHPGTACPMSTSPSIPTGPEATWHRMNIAESWRCH